LFRNLLELYSVTSDIALRATIKKFVMANFNLIRTKGSVGNAYSFDWYSNTSVSTSGTASVMNVLMGAMIMG